MKERNEFCKFPDCKNKPRSRGKKQGWGAWCNQHCRKKGRKEKDEYLKSLTSSK